MNDTASPPALTTLQIFRRFLRFGMMAWGGPVAQIAMVRRDLVDEEGWVSSGRFNRLLAIYQVLPGPEAHELCVHLGMVAGQRRGGIAAGLGFMLPGFALMLGLSWLYFHFDLTQSALGAAFLGVQAGVIALIVRAVHRIGGHVLLNGWLWGVGIAGSVAAFFGASFWIVLPAAGLFYPLLARRLFWAAAVVLVGSGAMAFLTLPDHAAAVASAQAAPALLTPGSVQLLTLFLSGLKAGLLTFGGAYTVIPFLRSDAVGKGWMADGQFLDGVALSGILPAPLIIFSTFVGYYAGGLGGAFAMTAGIFLPAFAFSLLFYDGLERVVENERLHRFLEGVAAGVVGFIVATTLELVTALIHRVPTPLIAALIFAGALAILYLWKSKFNMVAAILASGFVGYFAMA